MSTLRNTIQRRNHRERAQPLERQKWGILEKPKDYKLRAADHKVKKRKIKTLQQKAAERNDDEFYFGMMSNQSQGGVKVAQRGNNKVLGEEVVKLMKTQDVGYLRTVLQQTRRERERVGREVISGQVGVEVARPVGGGKRVLFGEDGEAVEGAGTLNPRGADAEEWVSSDEEEGDASDAGKPSGQERKKRKKQDARRKKLQALEERERDMAAALHEVEMQRAKMNGTVGGVNKNGVKFKVRERKR
ncbi:uncharacterized protein LTR77_004017 [Saxophila tyrrhenica]|uniref:U3 small nucleolar RNA-associated protein 11 n=1 Tax=Saxophila tyrrhenica TaxID=1690608 RepID=A0AAV9PFK9_9PEZI|nr:hypothetical protein LTR77_004017 [Saxophila tyrrhenica]